MFYVLSDQAAGESKRSYLMICPKTTKTLSFLTYRDYSLLLLILFFSSLSLLSLTAPHPLIRASPRKASATAAPADRTVAARRATVAPPPSRPLSRSPSVSGHPIDAMRWSRRGSIARQGAAGQRTGPMRTWIRMAASGSGGGGGRPIGSRSAVEARREVSV